MLDRIYSLDYIDVTEGEVGSQWSRVGDSRLMSALNKLNEASLVWRLGSEAYFFELTRTAESIDNKSKNRGLVNHASHAGRFSE